MFWADKLIGKLDKDQLHIINDSKTPSGRAHVGALRGVLIHDVMFRVLKEQGFNVRYTFGVDDYDPLDELPYGKDEHFRQYLGMPLCNVPPPPGSDASDMSDYYITEFFNVFKYLGVNAETYRLRDIYRSGEFDEPIDIILSNADTVREVYKKISGSERADTWYPFQVVCENCGRIGTTEVTGYDGKEVTYTCHPNMVKWAEGCGHQGKMSPFSGNGKLPWKVEWVAKWATRGITVEGAGKDHTTKGGSRDVASNCLKRIFNKKAPLNIPYEFFLVEGAKMSSSRGIGVSAGEMAEFLPPEILRFLLLRPQPNRPINFSPDEQSTIKLFNDYDRYRTQFFSGRPVSGDIKEVYQLSEINPEHDYYVPNLQLLQALVQMPHINIVDEIRKRKEGELTDIELSHLNRRIESIKYWLEHYATDNERLQLQDTLPAEASSLSATQCAFLHLLAEQLPTDHWHADVLQSATFTAARLTPIKQSDAFQAIYKVLFGRDAGPKAGNLFEFMEPAFLQQRFTEVSYTQATFWLESSIDDAALKAFLEKHQENLATVSAQFQCCIPETSSAEANHGVATIEFQFQLTDQKRHMQRLLLESFDSHAVNIADTTERLKAEATAYVQNLDSSLNIPIALTL